MCGRAGFELLRHRGGAGEQAIDFSPLKGFLSTLMEYGGQLIDYPC